MTTFLPAKMANKPFFHIILLVLVIVLTYINIFQNDFAWDDEDFLTNWTTIRDIKNIPALVAGEIPENHRGVYRPLRSIIYVFSHQLWGTNPFGYHLQAIITHTLIVILIYSITYLISKKRFLSFLAALLFAVHPIHTESITYITASFDTIGIFFFFFSFYLYLKSENDKENKTASKLASLIYAAFAFFTYEMTLILPFLIILYEYCFKKLTFKNFTDKFRIYKPYFTLILSYLVTRLLIFHIGNRADYLGPSYFFASKQGRVGILEIFSRYISSLIFPHNLTIAHEVPEKATISLINNLNKVDGSGTLLNIISRFDIVLPLIFIFSLIFITSKLFKKNRMFIFCIAWFLLSLIIVSNILPQGAVIAERFLYIASFGFSLLSAYLIYNIYLQIKIAKHSKVISGLLILAIFSLISFYSITTILRNREWKNGESIWLSILYKNPKNAFANGALGYAYYREGNYIKAIDRLNQALSIVPNDSRVLYNIALAYEQKGDIDMAISQQQKLIINEPDYIPGLLHLGDLYEKKRQIDLAVNQYQYAIKLDPNQAFIHYYLGLLYERHQKNDEALNEYQQTISLDPFRIEAHNNMGIIYGKKENLELAEQSFKKSLEIDSKNYKAIFNLALIYEKQGKKELAIKEYENGLNVKPDEKEVINKLRYLLNQK